MKGGYYFFPDKLTFPFRHFVFWLQGIRRKKNVENEKNNLVETRPDEDKPGFFKRLGNYGNQLTNGISSGVGEIGTYFGQKKETQTNEKGMNPGITRLSNHSDAENENMSELKEDDNEESSPNDKDSQTKQVNPDEYWIVRIPIPPETNKTLVPFGKYEKMEEKVAQMEREMKVDKTLKMKCKKSMYEVGSRFVGICGEEEKECKLDQLEGSYMSKVCRMRGV
jgi:hypothetical protein